MLNQLRTLTAPLLTLMLASGTLAHQAVEPPGTRSTVEFRPGDGGQAQPTADLTPTVIVTGADQPGGSIGAALYATPDGFPNKQDKAAQTSVRPRTAPVDSLVFKGLAPGRYAVSVYHDQNSNTKLDTNLFGVPKEPWGTTGTVRPRLRAPRFEEAKINVATDTRVEIRVER